MKNIQKKYKRPELSTISKIKDIHDKKLRRELFFSETLTQNAINSAARSELLHTFQPGSLPSSKNKSYLYTQQDLSESLDLSTNQKSFNLNMDFGPYNVDFTRNGKHLVLGGEMGHISLIDWTVPKLNCEFNVKEKIRDIKFLHNFTMFATAQKKYVHIYDNTGVEIHCLRKLSQINKLDFLPYHFLLVAAGESGYLYFQDTSTGQLVAHHRTQLGPIKTMCQNPYNAVSILGHSRGVVTMWSPNQPDPLVKMLCHKAPLLSLSVNPSGNYLSTSGLDGQLKIWDIRTYKLLNSYYTLKPATSLSFSQKSYLSVGCESHIQVWNDIYNNQKQKSPYMVHELPGKKVKQAVFCPFQDVLGIGHSGGFSNIIIPGVCEPNPDFYEININETLKQRRESEVRNLLEKIPADMINLDPNIIGTITRENLTENPTEKVNKKSILNKNKNTKKKTRKKRRKTNVIDVTKQNRQRANLKRKTEDSKLKRKEKQLSRGQNPSALDRFY